MDETKKGLGTKSKSGKYVQWPKFASLNAISCCLLFDAYSCLAVSVAIVRHEQT